MRRYGIFVPLLAIAACTFRPWSGRAPDSSLEPGIPVVVEGVAKDTETGRPVAGLRVVFRTVGTRYRGEDVEVETDDAGRFSFRAPTGMYVILPSVPYGIASPRFWLLTEKGRRIDLRLTRGGALRGRVTDPDGHPLTGVVLRVWEDGAEREGHPHWTGEARTAEDGTYVVAGVPPGRTLRISLEPEWKIVLTNAPQRLQVEAGQELEVDLVARPR
jgi:hypothetical protein